MDSQTEVSVEREVVETLLDRFEFLNVLLDGPADKRSLVDATGSSRSTVTRAMRDLTSVDLVERTNGEYEVTAFGELLAAEFSSLLDTASFGWASRDVLAKLPSEKLGFELSRLADATITEPTTANPTAPMQRVVELKADASRVRSLASGRSPGAVDAHREALEHGGQEFESVCSEDLVAWLTGEPERREKIDAFLEHDDATLLVTDREIPLPLGILDDCVFFGVESEEGAPVALVESTDQHVREWATDLYESCARDATELTPENVESYASDT